MKIRTGFVSNSSSSSFVIGKHYMTDEQQREFNNLIDTIEDDETCINEDKYYYFGSIGHQMDEIDVFITSNDLAEYFSYGD